MSGLISSALEEWASRGQQFTSLEAGWSAFLDYVLARNGSELAGVDYWTVMAIVRDVREKLRHGDVEGARGGISTLEARDDVH